MSYTHVLHTLSGTIHALSNDSDGEWSVCGKGITSSYVDVDDPVTCKVCVRSIELSRDYRVARELTKRIQYLWEGIAKNPSACLSWVSSEIAILKQIAEGE